MAREDVHYQEKNWSVSGHEVYFYFAVTCCAVKVQWLWHVLAGREDVHYQEKLVKRRVRVVMIIYYTCYVSLQVIVD